jgi:hypothetical protein
VLAEQRLQGHGLMQPLDLRVVSRPTNAGEPDTHPKRQEPQMQTGWKG